MTAGDVTILLNSIASGSSIQIQTLSRCKFLNFNNATASGQKVSLSLDNVTYYTIGITGYAEMGTSGATTGDNYLYLPSGVYIKITNGDTVAHDNVSLLIEY